MGVVWGLVAAFGWGTADFAARDASVRVGAYRALLFAHLVSLGCLVVLVAFNPRATTISPPLLLLAALLGLLNTAGSLCLYHSLAIGQVAVVSPIASSFAAITLALSLLSGDPISIPKIGGLLLTIVGVVLAAISPSAEHPAGSHAGRGVTYAIGAALCFGVHFWGLKYVVPALGPWIPVLESRVMSLAALPLLAKPLGQSIERPTRAAWPAIMTIAILDTTANASYNLGLRSDVPGVVAVLGSLFSTITVLLAFVLLRERLAPRQWLGVVLIIVAIATLSALGA